MKTIDWALETSVQETWCFAENLFTPEECNTICNIGSLDLIDSLVEGDSGGNVLDRSVRNSKHSLLDSSIENNAWIFQRCSDAVLSLNRQFFEYDINKLESLQYGEYHFDTRGHFDRHVDALYRTFGSFRKLSFSIQLTDPKTYQGGDLLLHYGPEPDIAPKDIGTMIMFPSTMLHEVTPVTQGVRSSLVGWVLGPKLK